MPYPSDLTDAQWELVAPLFPVPKQGRGRPRKYTNRALLNAIFYQARTGCAWRYLPADFPPYVGVWFHFRRWRDSGLIECLHDALRDSLHVKEGRQISPSAAIMDSQSVKTAEKRASAVATMPTRRSKGASVT